MRVLWSGLGWSAAALGALGLLLRWLPVSSTVLLGLIGVLPLLIAPLAIAAAVGAWRSGLSALRIAAGLLGLVFLVTFLRPASVIGCGPTAAEDEIVIYSHNLLWSNQDDDAVATGIEEAGADLVMLQEIRPEIRKGLGDKPGLRDFHRASDSIEDKVELALWSRWPLTDVQLDHVAGRPQLSATVLSPRGEFRIHSVHLAAPVNGRLREDWSDGLDRLEELPADRPSLVAGDFNATVHHAQFRSVLGAGWTDVHGPKGCGFDATWPANHGRLPFPLLRLDHVLVTDHWDVLAVEIGEPRGSDHRSLITSVRLRS